MDIHDDSENETYLNNQIEDTQTLIPEPKKGGYHLEPVVFLIFFTGALFDTIWMNVIELQYCSAVLNRPQSDCLLNSTSVNQNEIEIFTTKFQMIRTIVEVTIPFFLTFFLGPWSDKYGRRPLLISSTLGNFICCTLWTWASNIPTLQPMYFIMFSIPYAVCGGGTLMYLCSYCYICDITPTEKRSFRLGILQGVFILGLLSGIQLAPKLNNYGYNITFAVAALFAFLSFFYTCFILPESIIPTQADMNSESVNPFSLSHIYDLIDNCYGKQSPVNRIRISIIIMILAISLMTESGESGVMYMFLQKTFQTSLSDYAFFLSYIMIVGTIIVTTFIIIFSHYLKIDDLYLLSFTAFTRLLAALCIVFGHKLWHIYLSRSLNGVMGLTGPLTRSYLSKIVPEEQLGKVFSLLVSVESLAPIFGSLFYTIVFNWTVATIPAAAFLLSGLFMLIELFLVISLIEISETPSTISDYISETPSINA